MKLNSFILTFILCLPFVAQAQTLDFLQAHQLTLSNNQSLLAKQQALQAEQETLDQAWSSVKPQIQLSAMKGRGEYDTTFRKDQEDDFERLSVYLVQPLYSAQKFNNISREKVNYELADQKLAYEQHTQTLEMTEAYLQVAKFQRLLAIVEDELADHKIKSQRIETMLERGLSTRMDILEAQSKQDEIRANLISTQNQYRIRLKQLERIIGEPVTQVAPLDENLWQRTPRLLKADWQAIADQQSLTLLMAQNQVNLAKKDLKVEQSGYYPELNIRAEYTTSDSYEYTFEDNKKVQIEFNMPIYQGGVTNSRVRAANQRISAKQYELSDVQRQLKVQIQEVLTNLEATEANILALQQSVKSNEAYLESAEKGLTLGVRGVFDILEAKARTYNTERRMIEEIYNNLYKQFELHYLVSLFDRNGLEALLNADYDPTTQIK